MQKKSFSWLLLVVAGVGGFLVYRYAIKPAMQHKGLERSMDQGSEAMAQEFNEQKEEIAEDLSAILSKMEELEADEAALRDQVDELRKDIQSDVK
jgi:hypothetical protein